jgi:hypothetical protein
MSSRPTERPQRPRPPIEKGEIAEMMHSRDALSGASLSSGVRVLQRASKVQAARPGPQGQNRARFCSGEQFCAGAFVSTLTALRSRYVPSRPKPFGETKKFFPWLGILPSLEAHQLAQRFSEHAAGCPPPCFLRRSRGKISSGGPNVTLSNHSAAGMQESVAVAVILRFSFRCKSGGPYAGQRTSYGLYNRASLRMPSYTTRLPGAFSPVDPDQRGATAPRLGSPRRPRRAGVA